MIPRRAINHSRPFVALFLSDEQISIAIRHIGISTATFLAMKSSRVIAVGHSSDARTFQEEVRAVASKTMLETMDKWQENIMVVDPTADEYNLFIEGRDLSDAVVLN